MKLGSVYFCSRGLNRASSYDIIDFDIKPLKLEYFENDFVKVLDFNLDTLNRSQILYLWSNLKEKNSYLKELLNNVYKLT